jgi:hypothetical protein
MPRTDWKSQIAIGRVFELKTRSKIHPTVCVLIVNPTSTWGNPRMCVQVDERGVIPDDGYNYRRRNPRVNVYCIQERDFTGRRIARRRRDLERFDEADISLIRGGFALDFGGRIHGPYCDGPTSLPHVAAPLTWTVFWTPDKDSWEYEWPARDELAALLSGAWHFQKRSYRTDRKPWGFAWCTAHSDPRRMAKIERVIRNGWPNVHKQTVQIVRWHDWQTLWSHTWQVGNPGPVFGDYAWHHLASPQGGCSYTVHGNYAS